MRIIDLAHTAQWTITYRNALPQGEVSDVLLPVLHATVDHLPEDIDALIATGDLQGRCGTRLLGEQLADEITLRAGRGLPSLDRIGVLLAGDLYAAPRANVRGASGPVDVVWEALARSVRWVVGVAGNHDEIERKRIRRLGNANLLDGDIVVRDGLSIAGLGGIVGKPDKPRRRPEERYLAAVRDLVVKQPDVLVLHESPTGDVGQRGREPLRAALEDRVSLVVSGHVYWPRPLAQLSVSTQALNVDGRVILLTVG